MHSGVIPFSNNIVFNETISTFAEYCLRNLLNDRGFTILDTNLIETKFTDGEIKNQGYYRCAAHGRLSASQRVCG